MDKFQIRLVSMLIPLRMDANETAADFCRRRNRRAGTVCEVVGRWSHTWACRVMSWHSHIERDTGKALWPTKLLELRDRQWLIRRRSLFAPVFSIRSKAWTVLSGRTATRSKGGKVPVRWEDGLIDATELADKVKHAQAKQRNEK